MSISLALKDHLFPKLDNTESDKNRTGTRSNAAKAPELRVVNRPISASVEESVMQID